MSATYHRVASNARIIAIVALCWVAFWEIYLKMGRPDLSFWNFLFATVATAVGGAILIGVAALFCERMVNKLDDYLFLIFPMIFPFFLLSVNVASEKLSGAAQEVRAELKEKPQDEQFHLISYVRNLLN